MKVATKMCERNISRGIPWHKDLSLKNKEIIVGKTCIYCGDIIGIFGPATKYHPECFDKHRKISQRKNYLKLHPNKEWEPKYCEDCGKLTEKTKWNKVNATRCDICQMKYTKKKVKGYIRPSRKGKKSKICAYCGKEFITNHLNNKYCPEHREVQHRRKTESDIANKIEKYVIAKDYLKHNGRINRNKKTGTFDTSPKYGPVEHIKTTNGEPNWEIEKKDVNRIKIETFSNKKNNRDYCLTEGDLLRGNAFEFKKKYGSEK